MYYKTLGYLTHHVALWYLRRRMPDNRQLATGAAAGLTAVAVLGVAVLSLRSRRTVPTV